MRAATAILLAILAVGAGGCGQEDVEDLVGTSRDQIERDVRERIDRVRADAGRVGRDVAERVQQVLEDLEKAVPEATPSTVPPRVGGRPFEDFLTEVLRDVDGYWTTTLVAADRPEPRVGYSWVEPNRFARSRCGVVADDHSAFYCPADDTIFIGQSLAAEVYQGIARGFPGQEAGEGRAVGDFGVAYLVAHEYAHNVQHELGLFTLRRGRGSKPFELQADCMAGLWANSVYRAGRLKPGDVQEAISTALAVGDFELGNEDHHGTPQERRDAWILGYDSGEPSVCRHFVQA